MFYTFCWNICPDLIFGGYVYAGVPPLYRIIEKNGKSYQYLKDDNALLKYRNKHSGEKYEVKRLKGLGEMSQEETAECLTNVDTRIIRQITVADATTAKQLFSQLMGENVVYRKKFLKDYGEEAMYNAE